MNTTVPAPLDGAVSQVRNPLPANPDSQLMQRIMQMALVVREKPFKHWPAWSTGEVLMVALVLDNTAALKAMDYSVLEALDRVDLSPRQLQQIARRVL